MNNSDEKRMELQREALSTLLENRRLILNWGTGVGKSRVAVEAVRRLSGHGEKILLLVNETAHKDGWRREFGKALGEIGEELYDSLTVECYASAYKYRGTGWDLIVMDEGHHMRSELKTEILSTFTSDYVLVLSATLSEKGDGDALLYTLERTFGPFKQLFFNVQEAIDAKILGKPQIYVHRIPLDLVTAPQTVCFDWGNPAKRVEVECPLSDFPLYAGHTNRYPSMSLRMSCSAREGYDFLTGKIDFFRKQYNAARKAAGLTGSAPDTGRSLVEYNRLVQYGNRRKMLLGQCKTTFARWLLSTPSLLGKKYICFCSDVDQGEELGGENIISSRRDDCATVIEAFNEGRIRSLFAVGMIQEGANLEGIEAGVIVQLGGKERVFVQKFGRALRARQPVQHIIVASDTRDEDYLRTALENIDRKYIKEIDWGERLGFTRRALRKTPLPV